MGLFNRLVKTGKENTQSKSIEQNSVNIENYKDVTFKYEDAIINVRIKPITVKKLADLKQYKSNPEELVSLIIQNCLVNKQDNKQYTIDQVKILFKNGLANALALKCLEVSNIPIEKNKTKTNVSSEESIKKVSTTIKQTNGKVKEIDEKQILNIKQESTDEKPIDIEAVKRYHSDKKRSSEKNNSEEITMEYLDILRKDFPEIQRWNKFLYEHNQQALKSLEEGDIEKATSILEENITVLADTPVTYSYLVEIYRLNEDYDNELRICNQAIDLIPSPKREEYINRKEEVINRKNNKGAFSGDEELNEMIKRLEKSRIKSYLLKGYYQTDEYKKEKEFLKNAQKEYLENNPTDFLLRGAIEYGISLSSAYNSSEDMKSLLTLSGNGKYLEEKGEYESAISVYEEANKLDKKIFPNANQPKMEKRIEICNKKIKKQKIKELETKAKELEKIDPIQSIGLYSELNKLNPNLKKYDKRIEILNRKIEN